MDETLHPPEAIAAPGKIVDRQNDGNCQRIHAFAGRDEIRIVIMRELGGKIIVGKLLLPRERNEMHPSLRLQFGQEIIWLCPKLEDGENLAALHFFDRQTVIEQDRLNLDA